MAADQPRTRSRTHDGERLFAHRGSIYVAGSGDNGENNVGGATAVVPKRHATRRMPIVTLTPDKLALS